MKTIIESFEERVKEFPDKTAVIDKEGSYSYQELDQISAKVASFILNHCKDDGIDIEKNIKAGKNGERIAVMFPRRKEFLGIILGIFKAGCCLINIDSKFPLSRISHIINDSQCKFVISSSEVDTTDIPANVINLEEILEIETDIEKPINLSRLDNEGVILYTSGSTGLSKGVLHAQRFFNSTIMDNWQDIYEITCNDKFASMAGFSFTVVFCDLLTSITHGASVYLLDENERLDASKIYEIIQDQQITTMFMPPKVLEYVTKTYDDINIKCIWTGGEKLYNVTERDYTVIENYGCSESPFILYREVKSGTPPKVLGKPSSFWNAFLLDEDGAEINEPGIVGELCVIGDYNALRYLNLPEQTDAKFIRCPSDNSLRMFKTGDLMAWADDEYLEYHGRNDYMVKLNGYRVELAEVEGQILQTENISETVCVIRNINGGDNLCCFFAVESPVDDEEKFISQIKEKIAQHLPEYMIPSIFVRLDALPRNINGKISRADLPEIDVSVHKAEFEAPTNELEELLCKGFSKVLNLEADDISINDNFYDLGGNSVLTMELLDYLRIPELTSMEIFKGKTVKNIAKLIKSSDTINKEQLYDSEIEEMKKDHQLTPFQSRLIHDQSCDFDSTVWNIPLLFSLKDADAEKLRDAVEKTVNNHPSLCVTFKKDDNGEILQHYVEGLVGEIAIEEISEDDFEKILPELVDTFDIFGGPLSRFKIFKTEENVYLFIDIHHLIIDGTSNNVLFNEITSAYNGKELEFNDYWFTFLKETEDLKDSSEYLNAKKYYSDKYGELSDWALVPKSDLAEEGYGIEITGILPIGVYVEDIEKAEKHFKTSRNVLGVAAALKAQSIHCNSNKVLVNWVYNNRNDHVYDDTVGCLIKSFPVGIDMETIDDDYKFLEEIKEQVIDGIANGSYEYLCENYESFTTDTLFVNYLGALRNSEGLKGFDPEVIDLPRPKDIAKMRVAIAILEDENGEILTGVEYCSNLYSKETAVKFHELLNKEFISLVKGGGE